MPATKSRPTTPTTLEGLLADLAQPTGGAASKAAMRIASLYPGKRAVHALIAALGHRNPHVRANAATSLGSAGDREAVAALSAALEDRTSLVRIMAVQSLGQLADPSAIPALEALAARDQSHPMPIVVREALAACRAAGRA